MILLLEVDWAWIPLGLYTGMEPAPYLPTPLPNLLPPGSQAWQAAEDRIPYSDVVEYKMEKQSIHKLSLNFN